MKDYDKSKESSYVKYWDVNNFYGCAISQKLPLDKFEWIEDTSKFMVDFIKKHNEESDEGYFLKVDIRYVEKLYELRNDLPLLPERKKTEKVEKLVMNVLDKTEYVIYIIDLKQALNHGLVMKKVHRKIKLD